MSLDSFLNDTLQFIAKQKDVERPTDVIDKIEASRDNLKRPSQKKSQQSQQKDLGVLEQVQHKEQKLESSDSSEEEVVQSRGIVVPAREPIVEGSKGDVNLPVKKRKKSKPAPPLLEIKVTVSRRAPEPERVYVVEEPVEKPMVVLNSMKFAFGGHDSAPSEQKERALALQQEEQTKMQEKLAAKRQVSVSKPQFTPTPTFSRRAFIEHVVPVYVEKAIVKPQRVFLPAKVKLRPKPDKTPGLVDITAAWTQSSTKWRHQAAVVYAAAHVRSLKVQERLKTLEFLFKARLEKVNEKHQVLSGLLLDRNEANELRQSLFTYVRGIRARRKKLRKERRERIVGKKERQITLKKLEERSPSLTPNRGYSFGIPSLSYDFVIPMQPLDLADPVHLIEAPQLRPGTVLRGGKFANQQRFPLSSLIPDYVDVPLDVSLPESRYSKTVLAFRLQLGRDDHEKQPDERPPLEPKVADLPAVRLGSFSRAQRSVSERSKPYRATVKSEMEDRSSTFLLAQCQFLAQTNCLNIEATCLEDLLKSAISYLSSIDILQSSEYFSAQKVYYTGQYWLEKYQIELSCERQLSIPALPNVQPTFETLIVYLLRTLAQIGRFGQQFSVDVQTMMNTARNSVPHPIKRKANAQRPIADDDKDNDKNELDILTFEQAAEMKAQLFGSVEVRLMKIKAMHTKKIPIVVDSIHSGDIEQPVNSTESVIDSDLDSDMEAVDPLWYEWNPALLDHSSGLLDDVDVAKGSSQLGESSDDNDDIVSMNNLPKYDVSNNVNVEIGKCKKSKQQKRVLAYTTLHSDESTDLKVPGLAIDNGLSEDTSIEYIEIEREWMLWTPISFTRDQVELKDAELDIARSEETLLFTSSLNSYTQFGIPEISLARKDVSIGYPRKKKMGKESVFMEERERVEINPINYSSSHDATSDPDEYVEMPSFADQPSTKSVHFDVEMLGDRSDSDSDLESLPLLNYNDQLNDMSNVDLPHSVKLGKVIRTRKKHQRKRTKHNVNSTSLYDDDNDDNEKKNGVSKRHYDDDDNSHNHNNDSHNDYLNQAEVLPINLLTLNQTLLGKSPLSLDIGLNEHLSDEQRDDVVLSGANDTIPDQQYVIDVVIPAARKKTGKKKRTKVYPVGDKVNDSVASEQNLAKREEHIAPESDDELIDVSYPQEDHPVVIDTLSNTLKSIHIPLQPVDNEDDHNEDDIDFTEAMSSFTPTTPHMPSFIDLAVPDAAKLYARYKKQRKITSHPHNVDVASTDDQNKGSITDYYSSEDEDVAQSTHTPPLYSENVSSIDVPVGILVAPDICDEAATDYALFSTVDNNATSVPLKSLLSTSKIHMKKPKHARGVVFVPEQNITKEFEQPEFEMQIEPDDESVLRSITTTLPSFQDMFSMLDIPLHQ